MSVDSESNEITPVEIEQWRSYLLVLARRQIPGALARRIDASDIVQETMLEAHRSKDEFNGKDQQTVAAWLRRILSYNLVDSLRKHQRQSRDIRREERVFQDVEQSAMGLERMLVADDTSPSIRLGRSEHARQLANALLELPEAQAEAIEFRYSQNLSIAEIAERMNKSTVAVAGLLKRGTARLRELLDGDT